jgi:uncharacterized protein DUF1842
MTTQTVAEVTTKAGVSHAQFLIGTELPGAPRFSTNLLFNFPSKMAVGIGEISQAVHPPLDLHVQLTGTFAPQSAPKEGWRVQLSGSPIPATPAANDLRLVNVELTMNLAQDWKTGRASYWYLRGTDKVKVDDVPVKMANIVAL